MAAMAGIEHTTGSVMAPDNACLILRGIATLGVRMERHCENAASVARYLESSPRVARPGLRSHPGYAVAARQMRALGGMVALELKGSLEDTQRFVNSLKLIRRAVSLGGVESLGEHPASMTPASFSLEGLKAAGISQTLIRLSVGIEGPEDIIAELDHTFAAI